MNSTGNLNPEDDFTNSSDSSSSTPTTPEIIEYPYTVPNSSASSHPGMHIPGSQSSDHESSSEKSENFSYSGGPIGTPANHRSSEENPSSQEGYPPFPPPPPGHMPYPGYYGRHYGHSGILQRNFKGTLCFVLSILSFFPTLRPIWSSVLLPLSALAAIACGLSAQKDLARNPLHYHPSYQREDTLAYIGIIIAIISLLLYIFSMATFFLIYYSHHGHIYY